MSILPKPVHPDRWNLTTHTRKQGVVVHDAESDDGSCQALINLMALPGDRPNDHGGWYGASYHAVTTNDPGDERYVQLQGPDHAPFAAPPVNETWWHICIPGRAAQTRDEWLDAASRAGIRSTARFIVDKAHADGFALGRLSVAELLVGRGGYCGHGEVSAAWHQSTHTDPGANFPWDVLASDIAALSPPPVEDDMKPLFIIVTGQPGQYLWAPGHAPIPFTDPTQRDLLLAACGIDANDGVTLSAEMFARLS